MSYLNWREVERREWEHPAPPAPNGSAPPSTDYGVTIREQATWPQDGSIYAGRTYEQRWVKQGPSATYRDHVIVSHSQYPAPPDDECAICVPGQCEGPDCPGWFGTPEEAG